jgi:hypothetical protein
MAQVIKENFFRKKIYFIDNLVYVWFFVVNKTTKNYIKKSYRTIEWITWLEYIRHCKNFFLFFF